MRYADNSEGEHVMAFTDDEIKTIRSALGNQTKSNMDEDKVSSHVNDYLYEELLAKTKILLPFEDESDIKFAQGLTERTGND